MKSPTRSTNITSTATFLAATLTTSLLAATTLHAQEGYDIQLIQYEGFDTQVFGVNNRGDAVGTSFDDVASYPFVYNVKKQEFSLVQPIAGFDFTVALGISDSGTVVGAVDDLTNGTSSGFITKKNGATEVFDHPDAASGTNPRGVNNKGLVTGFRDSVDEEGNVRFAAFVYNSRNGTFTDIVPSFFSLPQGINNKGEVVGSAIFIGEDGDACPPGRYGWHLAKDGEVSFFTVNDQRTSARGITDSGVVAGFVTTDDVDVDLKTFVVPLETALAVPQCGNLGIAADDLIAVDDAVQTSAGDISNPGIVAGNAFIASEPNPFFGFIATPQSKSKRK